MDYYLDLDGDLLLDQNGDIQSATGWDEVRQFCERVLVTCPQGQNYNGLPIAADYIFDPTFGVGLPRIIGKNVTAQLAQSIQLSILQSVLSNPDIASSPAPIVSISSNPIGGLQVLVDVTPVSGQTGTLGVIFTP